MRHNPNSPLADDPHTQPGKGASPCSLATFFAYLALFAVVALVIGLMTFSAMAEQAVTSAQEECAKYDYCVEYSELAGV